MGDSEALHDTLAGLRTLVYEENRVPHEETLNRGDNIDAERTVRRVPQRGIFKRDGSLRRRADRVNLLRRRISRLMPLRAAHGALQAAQVEGRRLEHRGRTQGWSLDA